MVRDYLFKVVRDCNYTEVSINNPPKSGVKITLLCRLGIVDIGGGLGASNL